MSDSLRPSQSKSLAATVGAAPPPAGPPSGDPDEARDAYPVGFGFAVVMLLSFLFWLTIGLLIIF